MTCLSDTMVTEMARGALGADARRIAEEHLAECPDCRRLVSELARLTPDGEEPEWSRDRRRARVGRLIRFAVAVGAPLLAATCALLSTRSGPVRAPRARALAVVDPRDRTGLPEREWMPVAAGEMVRLALVERGPTVSSGDTTARAMFELLGAPENGEGPLLASLRRRLEVEVLVLGSLSLDDTGLLRLELRLEAPARSEVVVVTGAPDDPLTLAERGAAMLRPLLGLDPLDDHALARLRARLPDGDGLRWYAKGLRAHRRFDARSARDHLERSAAAAPRNARVRAALSRAWESLGDRTHANAEGRRALALDEDLSPTERLAFQAHLHEIAGEWNLAIAAWRSLHALAPDEPRLAVRLADALVGSKRADEALTVLAPCRAAGSADEAALALGEARAALAAGDAPRAARAADRAARAGEVIAATALVASAHRVQSAALAALGDERAALAEADRARSLWAGLHDAAAEADALLVMGRLTARMGQLSRALALYEEARDLAQANGDVEHLRPALESIAVLARHGQ